MEIFRLVIVRFFVFAAAVLPNASCNAEFTVVVFPEPETGISVNRASTVESAAVAAVFQTWLRNKSEGDCCTGTPLVAAVVFTSSSALVNVVAIPLFWWVCAPVHVGVIVWSMAGAASERIAVLAEPFTVESPTLVLGLANPLKDPGKSPAWIAEETKFVPFPRR